MSGMEKALDRHDLSDPAIERRREIRDRVAGDMFARWFGTYIDGCAPPSRCGDATACEEAAACVRLATILAEALYPVAGKAEATNAGK